VTRQIDWLGDGYHAGYDRQITYNGRGQIESEFIHSRQGADTWQSHVGHHYGGGSDYALGAVVSTTTHDYKLTGSGYQWQYSTTTTNTYHWRDGAVQGHVSFARTGQPTHATSFHYDGRGELASVQISDGRPRTVSYVADMAGQVIRRDEADYLPGGDPHEIWYRFGGKQMGYTGNNFTLATDYQTSIDTRTMAPGPGPFRFGQSYHAPHTDFDLSLDPITSYRQGSSQGGYTARAGDTLAGIAALLWGDASLWYKLAEANGLTGEAALHEGQRLTVSAGVMKTTHNSSYQQAELASARGRAHQRRTRKLVRAARRFGAEE
jgi:trimeric autotransporter adhesin